jgi:hypothetical protein
MWLEIMILVDGAVHFHYWQVGTGSLESRREVHLTQRIELMR